MIKKAGEMAKEVRENMRGGSGKIEITHAFKQDELKGKARLCARMTVNPGCSVGLHEHINEEEIYYIMRGKGIIEEDGRKYEVSAGDAVLTGGGASHAVYNTGDQPMEIFAVVLLY